MITIKNQVFDTNTNHIKVRSAMKISEFQQLIEDIYLDRDSQRGIDRNFVWFTEEVGELAREIRQEPRNKERLFEEFANVFAWLSTLASLLDIDLDKTV